MIGKQSGKVGYAVMSFGRFLGIGKTYFPLPWSKLTYNPRLEGYEVNITVEQLRGAPKLPTMSSLEPRPRSAMKFWRMQPPYLERDVPRILGSATGDWFPVSRLYGLFFARAGSLPPTLWPRQTLSRRNSRPPTETGSARKRRGGRGEDGSGNCARSGFTVAR
jgi:hypothetical protein